MSLASRVSIFCTHPSSRSPTMLLLPLCALVAQTCGLSSSASANVSRIRHLQDLQVSRHASRKREPSLLPHLRVVWFPTLSGSHQGRFQGPDRTPCQACLDLVYLHFIHTSWPRVTLTRGTLPWLLPWSQSLKAQPLASDSHPRRLKDTQITSLNAQD